MTKLPSTARRIALATTILPLALGLAACKKDDATAGGAPSGAPVAKVSPPAGTAWSDQVEKTKDGGYRMGNPDAPIKLVEYGSLSCPHCAHLAEESHEKLVSDYVDSGRVSFEYRSYAIHSIDVPLTILVECADKSAFFPLVNQLYDNQPALMANVEKNAQAAETQMQLPADKRFVAVAQTLGFTQFFAQRGLPETKANACLADPAAATTIAKFAQDTGAQGIDATPTLIINGHKIDGATWADLEPALKAAGAR